MDRKLNILIYDVKFTRLLSATLESRVSSGDIHLRSRQNTQRSPSVSNPWHYPHPTLGYNVALLCNYSVFSALLLFLMPLLTHFNDLYLFHSFCRPYNITETYSDHSVKIIKTILCFVCLHTDVWCAVVAVMPNESSHFPKLGMTDSLLYWYNVAF